MAVYTDPRFSNSEERSAERRVDEAFEKERVRFGIACSLGARHGVHPFRSGH